MASGAISDEQISASSEQDATLAASRARLYIHLSGGKKGAWRAGKLDPNQWLQIDLDSGFTRVTRVATQGRSDFDQWVTSYKLQYSNNGVTFHYYIKHGQTVDKVKQIESI